MSKFTILMFVHFVYLHGVVFLNSWFDKKGNIKCTFTVDGETYSLFFNDWTVQNSLKVDRALVWIATLSLVLPGDFSHGLVCDKV